MTGNSVNFTEQMATKLLAQAIRQLGQAVNETLCVQPDRYVIRGILDDVRSLLQDFDDAYFDSEDVDKNNRARGPGEEKP